MHVTIQIVNIIKLTINNTKFVNKVGPQQLGWVGPQQLGWVGPQQTTN